MGAGGHATVKYSQLLARHNGKCRKQQQNCAMMRAAISPTFPILRNAIADMLQHYFVRETINAATVLIQNSDCIDVVNAHEFFGWL